MKMSRGFRRVAIAAVVILLPVAAWTVWDYVEAARLARLIRTIHEKGEPLASHELAPLPLPLNEEEKQASRYYLAAAVLASDVYEGGKVAPDAVERFGDALMLLDRATLLDFSQLQPGTEFSYRTAGFLQLSTLNSIRTVSLARAGKGDDAARSLIASIRLRRVMATLLPVASDVANSMGILASAGVMLRESTPSADALRAVQEALEKAERATAVEDGIAALRGRAIQRFWSEYYGGTVIPTIRGVASRLPPYELAVRPWRTGRFVARLRMVNQQLDAARLPWPGKLDAVEARPGNEAPAPPPSHAAPPAGRPPISPRWWTDNPLLGFGELSSVRRAATRVASDRAVIAALAVQRFRRAHAGRTPVALPELSPEFLTSTPEDPFRGKPLLYRRDETGYVLYSVGANRADDNGAVGPEGSDVGLRISTRQR